MVLKRDAVVILQYFEVIFGPYLDERSVLLNEFKILNIQKTEYLLSFSSLFQPRWAY